MKRLPSLIRKILATLIFSCLVSLGLAQLASPVLAADMNSPCTDPISSQFTVTITNVSNESDAPTPFAPGLWVLHDQAGPLYTSGQAAGADGLEDLAEDGSPVALAESLFAMGSQQGVFTVPEGAYSPGPLLPGHSYSFKDNATTAANHLSFALMFVQSNDWFVGTGEAGLPLMGDTGIGDMAADVTSQLYLWDAGTEADEPVGEGPNQAPRQAGPNTGPADTDNTVHQVVDGPAVTDLVRVTITPVEPTVFAVYIRNLSDQSMYSTPFAPGVFAVHSAPYVLFEDGKPSYDNGLEALAEDGDPSEIVAALASQMVDGDGMEKDINMADDAPMLMGMSLEEAAGMAELVLNVVMTTPEEELPEILHEIMPTLWGIWPSLLMSSLDGDTARGPAIKEIVSGLMSSMSEEEIRAIVWSGIEAVGLEDQVGMTVGEMVDQIIVGMETVQIMEPQQIAMFIVIFSISGMGDMGNPPLWGIDLADLIAKSRESFGDLLVGMTGEDLINMMLMNLSMVIPEESGHDMDLIQEDSDQDMETTKGGSDEEMDMMMSQGKVHAGVFNTPVGMDEPGPLLPGATYAFAVSAYPSTPRLSLASMFVQSNDWFLSTPPEGVALFTMDGTPMEGVAPMSLYDAGTEEDELVAGGMNDQAPRQSGPNTGSCR